MITRRELLAGIPLTALGQKTKGRNAPARPKLAGVVTVYHKYSHAQHIVDRFLEGYGWNGRIIIRPWIWWRCTSTRSARMT